MARRAEDLPRMTVEEFLEWDDGTDTRYELIHGQVVPKHGWEDERTRAMAPPSPRHGALVSRLAGRIGDALTLPCRAYADAGVRVSSESDTFVVPDLAVSCRPLDQQEKYLADPVLVVEVLSPSTINKDRGTKVDQYRSLASVQEILLVSSNEKRVQIWRRDGECWIVEDLIGDAHLTLASLDLQLDLADLYQGL